MWASIEGACRTSIPVFSILYASSGLLPPCTHMNLIWPFLPLGVGCDRLHSLIRAASPIFSASSPSISGFFCSSPLLIFFFHFPRLPSSRYSPPGLFRHIHPVSGIALSNGKTIIIHTIPIDRQIASYLFCFYSHRLSARLARGDPIKTRTRPQDPDEGVFTEVLYVTHADKCVAVAVF